MKINNIKEVLFFSTIPNTLSFTILMYTFISTLSIKYKLEFLIGYFDVRKSREKIHIAIPRVHHYE